MGRCWRSENSGCARSTHQATRPDTWLSTSRTKVSFCRVMRSSQGAWEGLIFGGSMEVLMRSIEERLLTLPDETWVYPGHGPQTTIGNERTSNPFLQGGLF